MRSQADVVGYGGSAGGGKSDLELGLALTHHRDSIIFRREYPQLRGLIERSREIIGDRGRFNSTASLWRMDDGRKIEFGACQHPQDVNKYRGRPHDLIAIDEATEFQETQFRFLMGWLRTTIPAQRCRVVLTFNPPTNTEGQWVVRYFAPWLEETHPNPAMPGELRWFATVDGQEIERPDGKAFEHTTKAGKVETIQPQSRTFFPARLADNPILAATGYGATLQALPEPLRSQLLYGDFKAGLKDHAWQVIPTAWVKAAQVRWKGRKPEVKLTCIGADVAHGGADKSVNACRYGNYFAELDVHEGVETPTGAAAASFTYALWKRGAYVNVDAIGVGASAHERLADLPPEGFGIDARAINVSSSTTYTDKSGKFGMANVRAEMYWRLREALDPEGGDDLALPPSPSLLADLTAPTYEVTPSGIKIESKEKLKARIGGRSPDEGDAVALAMLPDMEGSWGFG